MSSPLPIRFLQSASRLDQLPNSVLELAIVGRSNVGKSSLINALAHRKKLAKTSKTPELKRTKLAVLRFSCETFIKSAPEPN